MQPQQDYQKLLTEVIKKQIVILGPDITLAKARNVQGLIVADDGTVTDISGNPQQITQRLIDQFVQLSGEIVKKTMEPLLTINQTNSTVSPTNQQVQPTSPLQTTVTPAAMAAKPAIQTTQKLPTPQAPSPVQDTLAQQAKPMQ